MGRARVAEWRLGTLAILFVLGVGNLARRLPAGPGPRSASPQSVPVLDSGSISKEPTWQVLEGQFTGIDDCSEAVFKSVLGATDEQWRSIQPALARLHAVREQTRSSIHMLIGVAGGTSGSGSRGFSSGSGAGASGSARGQAGAAYSGRVRTGRLPMSRTGRPNPRVQRPAAQGANNPSGPTTTSSWGWWRPSQHNKGQVTPGEALCEQLLDLTANRAAPPEQLREKMQVVNEYRTQAQEKIRAARDELRRVVTRRQEAMLILMGDLD
jgi:hypothetical protein